MNLISRVGKRAFDVVRQPLRLFTPRDPVYVFHHIPKCGGTSLNKILDSWFLTIKDYRSGWAMNYPEKAALSHLRSCHCLCGHFELDGYHLYQRYPEVFTSNRYRVFTFVRDPLQVQLSLFRYEKMNGQSKTMSIEDHLFLRPNYIANRFPATLDNYKDVIDRYCFVGILEESDASIAILASMMGRHFESLPWLNKSQKDVSSNTGSVEISQELVKRFRDENVLDYLIYDYCVEQLRRISAEHI